LRDWLDLVRPRLKAGTIRSYSDIIEHRLIPHIGDERLSELQPAAISRCYTALRTSGRRDGNGGLSETSIEHTHRCLHAALEHAFKNRQITRNVADAIVKPKRGHVEMHTWTGEQLLAFLDSTEGQRFHELYVVAATTAARRGELLGLKWDDVDLAAGRLSIRRSRSAIGYEVVETTPKSGRARTISLESETVAVLRRWRQHQRQERLAWGEGWSDSGYLFTREDGRPLHPHQVADAFDAAVRRSGQPTIRFHDLRHGWAQSLWRPG